jgi:lipid-binding SYLF domain-containing protein
VKPDKEANEALYGRPITGREILVDGKVQAPPAAEPVKHSINQHMAAAAKEKVG